MSYCFKLESHPGVLLIDHLKSVGVAAQRIIDSKTLSFQFSDHVSKLALLIGLCHDFGKATLYFQKYIKGEPINTPNRKCLKNHSRISALFGLYAAEIFVKQTTSAVIIDNECDEKTQKNLDILLKIMPVLVYDIINRHHGNLEDIDDEINYLRAFSNDEEDNDDYKVILRQLKTLKDNSNKANGKYEIDEIISVISENLNIEISLNDFEKFISSDKIKSAGKAYSKIYDSIIHCDEDFRFMIFYITELLYSVLLYCDKEHAIFQKTDFIRCDSIKSDLIDRYYKLKQYDQPVNELDSIRLKYYQTVTDKAAQIDIDRFLYSINMPTGTGKTLSSLSFALKLKERLKVSTSADFKIIYCLPFISVIDQNHAVMLDVLEKSGIDSNSEKIIKYHSLADSKFERSKSADSFENEYDNEPELEFSGSKARFLLENWQSQFVFTTFVQFFDSFFANRNSAAVRFHNMANSIIILDEVQNIPNKFWKILNKTMNFLAETFKIYFVLSTATLPLIFSREDGEITELTLPEMKEISKKMPARIKIDLNDLFNADGSFGFKRTTILELSDFLGDVLKKSNYKSALVVLNTIDSSIQFHDLLKNKIAFGEISTDYDLIYLSTNIVPKDRMARIAKIKQYTSSKSDKNIIVVSTQMVEAGVDVDFEYVIRDMAPLDSINQVGGRCNRNFKNGSPCTLKLFNLFDETKDRGGDYSKRIYDPVLLDKTRECLIRFRQVDGCIEESSFGPMSLSYFEKVRQAMAGQGVSDIIIEYIKKLKFSLKSDEKECEKDLFRLIEERAYERNVFIELDEQASNILVEYNKIKSITDRYDAKDRFETIRREFLSFVINVPKNKIPGACADENELVIINKNELFSVYDGQTGFIRRKSDVII